MRSLSDLMKAAVAAQECGDEWAYLLTITHASLGAPIRATNVPVEVISNGLTYAPYGFTLDFPEDTGDTFGTVRIVIDNVDQWLTSTIRTIEADAQVSISLVMLAAPDVHEVELRPLSLVDASYDAQAVTATLSYEPFFAEPFPGHTITPSKFPGAF